MVLMALVGVAEHTEVACAALHTAVVVEAAAAAVAVAVAEPVVVEVVEDLVAACYDAVPVPVGIGCPLHGSSHSTPALLPWHDHRR